MRTRLIFLFTALVLAAPLLPAQTTQLTRAERLRQLFTMPKQTAPVPRTVAPVVRAHPTTNSRVVVGIAAPLPQTIARSEIMPTVVNPLAGQELPMTREQYLRRR